MKKLFAVIAIMLIPVFALTGCNNVSNNLDGSWRRVYSKEVFVYEVTKQDLSGVGTLTITATEIAEGADYVVPTVTEELTEGNKTITVERLYSVFSYEFIFNENTMSSVCIVDSNLKPVYSFKKADYSSVSGASSAANKSNYMYCIDYSGTSASTTLAVYNSETSSFEKQDVADHSYNSSASLFDNDEIIFILRSLTSIDNDKCSYSYNVYSALDGEVKSMYSGSTPKQTIENVPYFTRESDSVTVNCHKVSMMLANLDIPGKYKYVYYSADTVTANDDLEVEKVPVMIEENDVVYMLKSITVTPNA